MVMVACHQLLYSAFLYHGETIYLNAHAYNLGPHATSRAMRELMRIELRCERARRATRLAFFAGSGGLLLAA